MMLVFAYMLSIHLITDKLDYLIKLVLFDIEISMLYSNIILKIQLH